MIFIMHLINLFTFADIFANIVLIWPSKLTKDGVHKNDEQKSWKKLEVKISQ